MNIADIRKLHWGIISGWYNIPKTSIGSFRKRYIKQNDINNFITDYIKELARKFCVEYAALEKLIREENFAFYSLMDDIFEEREYLSENDASLLSLQNFFKVPYVPSKSSNPVAALLSDFQQLTDIQKAEVLTELNLLSVKVIDKKNREYVKEL